MTSHDLQRAMGYADADTLTIRTGWGAFEIRCVHFAGFPPSFKVTPIGRTPVGRFLDCETFEEALAYVIQQLYRLRADA